MNLKLDFPAYVTRPILPELGELLPSFEAIWDSKLLTNHGRFHDELEQELKKTLKSPNVSVFNNGTIALLTALKALDLPVGSEVITTPFTFPATVHCISWNALKPVFCDIEPDTMTIDAEKIEGLINCNTSAILGVHVYGFPCNNKKIARIAQKCNLKIVYDAAHAFASEIDGKSIGCLGDISMYSFHATKLFHTIEGGCLTYSDSRLREKIYYLRNFGIKNEEEVVDIGINGKMNELQAAVGLLNLQLFEDEKMKRQEIKSIYIDNLKNIEGIKLVQMPASITDSLQYFVIRIDKNGFGLTRDELYDEMKKYNVFTRKYFYPLCSDYDTYTNLPSSAAENLPVANRIKDEVLCLPFYGALGREKAQAICGIVKYIKSQKQHIESVY